MSGGFNFGTGGGPSPFTLASPAPSTTTAANAALNFNFASPSTTSSAPPNTGGFSFNTGKLPSTNISGGFPFGNTLNASSTGASLTTTSSSLSLGGGGFNFNTPATKQSVLGSALSAPSPNPASTAAPAAGFNFLQAPAPAAATTAPQGTTAGFSFNIPQSSSNSSLFTLPAASSTAAPATSNTASAAAAPPPPFNFSAAPNTAPTTFNMPSANTASVPASSTSTLTGLLGAKLPSTTTSQPVAGFNFSATASSSAAASGIKLSMPTATSGSAAPATAASTALGFGTMLAPKTTTPSVNKSLAATGFSVNAAGFPSSSAPALLSSTTTTSSNSTTPSLNVRMLEEKQNKWMLELKEQEERFMSQAVHINAWDQVLQQGHNQVQSLKDNLQGVKSDQSRLEAELDFIRGQQEELEQLLEPLEASVVSNATSHHQGDRQRDNMYHLAQNLDGQLRQMTDDLCKVIEHLNGNSTGNQSSDPVTMVARILSAHMDTLKWVEQNSHLLNQKVDELSRNCDTIM